VWSYAGVRPLYDDGTVNPSQVSRDYVTKVDDADGAAPLLTLFGGKITTYRTLAEAVLDELEPYYTWLAAPWTANEPLPGGDVKHFNAFRDEMHRKYAGLPRDLSRASPPPWQPHGSRARRIDRERRPRQAFRRGPHGARGRLPRRRGMGADGRGCALAPHQVRAAHDPAEREAVNLHLRKRSTVAA
jgi:hypothetical protein